MSASKNIQKTRLVDGTDSDNAQSVNASGQAAIQDPPNLDAATSTLATESTLTSIDGKDFATETTLDAIRDNVGETTPTPTTNTVQDRLKTIQNKDFATETTLATRATESTLDAIRDNIGEAVVSPTADTLQARIQETIDILTAIRDTAGIKKITDALPTGDNWIGRVKIGDGTNIVSPVTGGDSLVGLYGLSIFGHKADNDAQNLLVEADGTLRVATQPASAPESATALTFAVNESELDVGSGGDVSSPHTTLGSIIANGDQVYLQSIEAGTEGDSAENGSVVELYWRTSGPTDHLIGRYYIVGQTVDVLFPNVHEARDGTVMTGDGTNTRLVVVRRRLSTAALEIDFVIRGYIE